MNFIVNDMETAIEVKSSKKIKSDHLNGLKALKEDFPKVKNRWVVCLEDQFRVVEDGIEIVPFLIFIERLKDNQL